MNKENTRICVVGLGYVGLPLAVAFGKKTKVIGFDINKIRIEQLNNKIDKTKELTPDEFKNTNVEFTSSQEKIKACNFIIVAVPTPITDDKKPDLSFLKSASSIVGKNLSKDSIVVYESTVYPGATEEECLPILEKESGLKLGEFKIGYSPERINPGDKEHTVDKIVKIVAGCDEESGRIINQVYSMIIDAGVYQTENIKTAEAAKVIENIQRDLNIALMNELSLIFQRMGIDTLEVIEAAGTKWNFHKYTPGLVGGHCIGIDPYYLTFKAQSLGYNPKVILAGREINDDMPRNVSNLVIKELIIKKKNLNESKVLMMGLTFKENVSDIRNSKAKDIIKFLKGEGILVIAYEPLLENKDILDKFNVQNFNFNEIDKVDCVLLINNHDEFKKISLNDLKEKMDEPILIDIKGFYDKKEAKESGFVYKSL